MTAYSKANEMGQMEQAKNRQGGKMKASKYRALLVATGILLALGLSAQADVTGYFQTH